jgi:hypothetical protein
VGSGATSICGRAAEGDAAEGGAARLCEARLGPSKLRSGMLPRWETRNRAPASAASKVTRTNASRERVSGMGCADEETVAAREIGGLLASGSILGDGQIGRCGPNLSCRTRFAGHGFGREWAIFRLRDLPDPDPGRRSRR